MSAKVEPKLGFGENIGDSDRVVMGRIFQSGPPPS